MSVSAQSLSRTVVCSAGTTVTTGGYSITYTLGEAVGDLFTSNPDFIYLTAGFAQPDFTTAEIMAKNDYISPNFTIFPNPAVANSNIKLGFKNLTSGEYSIAIIDVAGKILQTRKVLYKPTYPNLFAYQEFSVASLASGVYFVKVLGENNFKATISFLKQ